MNEAGAEQFLLVLETQKVKSWLFASPILRETRGASVLLDLLNRKEIPEHLGKEKIRHDIIYLGGGSGRILFNSRADAETGREVVEKLYADRAAEARIACAIRAIRAEENLPEAVGKGIRACGEQKHGVFPARSRIAGRWIQPCTSCGSRPAEEEWNEFGTHLLCRSCLQKRDAVNGLYREVSAKSGTGVQPAHAYRPRPLKSADELEKQYVEEFIFTTLAQKYEEQCSCPLYLPRTTDDIGAASRPSNYIGFIYADGDRMGEAVQKISRLYADNEEIKQAYTAFSAIIDQATREAAVEAVLAYLPPERAAFDEKGKFLPAEFLMAGGDDLMLIVPAHAALDVTLSFMELFQQKTCRLQEEYCRNGKLSSPFAEQGLTTSAGVVLAHAHYPVSELMELAADLMKSAKRKSAQREQEQQERIGALDFMVLAESSTESISERRKREYTRFRSNKAPVLLTKRPYTVPECHRLLNLIRQSKADKMPRNKLKALYAALFKNPYPAQFEALHIRQRLQATGNLKEGGEEDGMLHRFFMQELDRFPYRRENEQPDAAWTSPLSEFMELYDFIPQKARTDTGAEP